VKTMIEDLMDPACFPDPTRRINLVQTHISFVFIGDSHVYKIKKPVDFGFLDFSTLEKRRYYCEQEVKLNKRLSRDIYLGVLPVVLDGGRHRIGEMPGRAVEWAVRMRRIPEESLMKSLFHKGALTERHLEETADLLSGFHANAERSADIDHFGRWETFKVNTDENFAQTREFVGRTISPEHHELIKGWTEAFYSENAALFEERIRQGRIRDCHGDLHMEHICFLNPAAAIDCIEFNDRFRYSDTLADIAFLLMDLEFQGGADQARALWDLYARRAGERQMDRLLTFYKVYRAYVRGKVIGFQLNDPNITDQGKAEARGAAGSYFRLAVSTIEREG